MTRPLRIELPDAIYHVAARGNRREAIFVDDDDRQRFLQSKQTGGKGEQGAISKR